MNTDISPVIYSAIEILKKSFGGTNIELVSFAMYRNSNNQLGVLIRVEGILSFLGCESNAEDICTYGIKIAEQYVFNISKESDYINKMKRKIRIKKINEIDIKNHILKNLYQITVKYY
jgi:hypothetical protein